MQPTLHEETRTLPNHVAAQLQAITVWRRTVDSMQQKYGQVWRMRLCSANVRPTGNSGGPSLILRCWILDINQLPVEKLVAIRVARGSATRSRWKPAGWQIHAMDYGCWCSAIGGTSSSPFGVRFPREAPALGADIIIGIIIIGDIRTIVPHHQHGLGYNTPCYIVTRSGALALATLEIALVPRDRWIAVASRV